MKNFPAAWRRWLWAADVPSPTEVSLDQQPLGERLALLTDLYQLTMAACYFDQDMHEEATFSLFIRKYPARRSYFVAAGLAEALSYLETLRFTEDDLAYLASTACLSAFPGLPERGAFHRRGLGLAGRQHLFRRMSPSWK